MRYADLIPTSWLDPILTGPNAVIDHTHSNGQYLGSDIENVLRAVKKRVADAEASALPEGAEKAEWLIWSNEHQAWWGPHRCGYPSDPRRAGRYTLSAARDICRQRHWLGGLMPPETMIHESEVAIGACLPQQESP